MQQNVETPSQASKSTRTNGWTKNIVTDPDSPQYYSPRAIWAFSVVFTVIFGAVLLSCNLTDKKAKGFVIGFGILYTALVVIVMNLLPQANAGLTIALNGGGAFVLTKLFWDKYVGTETKFRTKPIWKALIISVLITIPFIFALIYG